MATRTLRPVDELLRLSDNSTEPVERAIFRLADAKLSLDPERIRRATVSLADLLRQTGALADLLGRKRAFLELDAAEGKAPPIKRGNPALGERLFSYARTPTVPNVPFTEAFNDIVTREPRLARSADLVSEVYSRERGFALARSADIQITEAIQRVVQRGITRGRLPGLSLEEAIRQIGRAPLLRDMKPFTQAYSQTVFRTNLATAHSAGRFRESQKEAIKTTMPAFEYQAVRDVDVRRGRKEDGGENHLALDGLIAATNSQIWQRYAPPNGYT